MISTDSANAAKSFSASAKDEAAPAAAIHIVHVTSSRFFGGPERQMLELARELTPEVTTTFVSFSEGGRCEPFLGKVRELRFEGIALANDTPRLVAAAQELAAELRTQRADIVCVHGYKAGLLGLWAGRKCGIPVVAVSRGWTGECWRVRFYEKLDRLALRRMDKVISVSHGQAEKVKRAGVSRDKVTVIHNAIRVERFAKPSEPEFRRRLEAMFGARPPRFICGLAGRLSPEKGFSILIEAAALLARDGNADFGIVLFGDGALRQELQRQIDMVGLSDRIMLAGFASDLDQFMPHFDVFVQSSHTEGLPNVLLEAAAAGVPVVATDVGGTREVVVDGMTGVLVPPNSAAALSRGLACLLSEQALRVSFQQAAPKHVLKNFTFASQAEAYKRLFHSLMSPPMRIT